MAKPESTQNEKNKGLFYSRMKVFHYIEKIESLPRSVLEIMAPIQIRIKPTNICNHNCCYCAYKVDNLQLGKDMVVKDQIPKEKILEIVDDIIEIRVKSVTFSGGGEPFCYPYLIDAVNKLAQSPVKFAALTNGSKLDGELAEVFAQHGTWLRISIDGWDKKSYSEYRGVKPSEFTKVMSNMEKFKNLRGACYLGIVFVVDKKNADHVYEFIKRIKDFGVDSVKISPCIISNNGEENNRYHKPIFSKVKNQVKKAIEILSDNNFEIFDAYHELDEKFKKDYTWCPRTQILPVIGADQNIYPCQDKAYNLKEGWLGSIKNRRFKEFWFSHKENFFKIDPSTHCNHHCVANVQNKLILDYLNIDRDHMEFV